ncbi:50S ribosomal protein L11 methyltransferase [Belliella marina]|uniref:Ribosomal protein L11 methyltransferase n=1 Tax=Belliella marina TaxID=1644146 RepID=A0ABW4VSA8_9BACT
MQYLEFKINCKEDFREILIAELSEVGFDSFLETDHGIDAYIEEGLFSRDLYQDVIDQYQEAASIVVEEGVMEKVNWNEEWEKHYDPIAVGDEVYVRASFHAPKPEIKHEILINPKMSFGTGHHATTFLMLSHQLTVDHQGKRVIDIGAGTGILAIMAHKLGAGEVEAFDIDDWCVDNGNENFDLNGMQNVRMGLGTVREVAPQGTFDIVLANINKNVLLDELEIYASLVKSGGNLLLSGFYTHDIVDIQEKADSVGFKFLSQKDKDNWAALIFEKL